MPKAAAINVEGTPLEIGRDAAAALLGPVLHAAIEQMPPEHQLDLCIGLMSGLGAIMAVHLGPHTAAALVRAWAPAMNRLAEEQEGPAQ
jgi:hypothetical protein